MTTRLVRNIFANYAGLLVIGTVNFLLIPFLVRHLGYEAYGILALCWSVAGILQFLEFGIHSAIVKYIAQWKAEGNRQRLEELLNTSLVLFLLLGLAGGGLISLLAARIPDWFHISPQHSTAARWALIWTGFSLIWYLPSTILGSFLEGGQRYDLSNTAHSVLFLMNGALSAFLVTGGYSVAAVSAASAFCHLMHFLILTGMVRRVFPEQKLRRSSFRVSTLREVRQYSIWSFLRDLAAKISWDLDAFLIGFFLSAGAISPYVLGRKFPYLLSALGWRWVEVLLPVASEIDAGREPDQLTRIFLRASRLSLAVSLCGALLLLALARPALTLWLGTVEDETVLVLRLVTVSILFDLLHAVSSTLLTGAGKLKRVSLYFLLDAFLNLTLSILLVQRLGIPGVALGTVISTIIVVLFLQIPYACREFRVPVRRFAGEILLPQILPATACAAVLILLPMALNPARVAGFCITGLAGFLAYATLFYRTGLSSEERALLGAGKSAV